MNKRPGSVKATNADISSFLNTRGKTANVSKNMADRAFARQDSGLTRASGDLSGRFGETRKAAPNALDDYGFPAAPPKSFNDYGARKRMPMSAADKKDKVIELERENNVLKEKENFLH